jgi:hypothetical protein
METNNNIEREIERSLETARGIIPINAPAQFTEKTMQRIKAVKEEPFISVSVLLKAAAVLILICLNAYTIKYVFESPAPQTPTVTATIDDLANDYTVADVNTDWLNNKITKSHE